jgi:hypothetical protein
MRELRERLTDTRLGDEFVACVAHRDPRQLEIFELAQHFAIAVLRGAGQRGIQPSLVLGERTRCAEIVVEELVQPRRVAREQPREERRHTGEGADTPDRVGRIAAPRGGQARRIGSLCGPEQLGGARRRGLGLWRPGTGGAQELRETG